MCLRKRNEKNEKMGRNERGRMGKKYLHALHAGSGAGERLSKQDSPSVRLH